MTKTFTENDVVKYLYNESSDKEVLQIEAVIKQDKQLQVRIQEVSALIHHIDSFTLQAPQNMINSILSVSKHNQSILKI